MAEFRRKRKKVCQLCAGKDLDYKNAEDLRKYINENEGNMFRVLFEY